MTEYYRAIFTVKDENIQGLTLLEKVISEARKWAQYEFGEPLQGERGNLQGPKGSLRFGTRSLGKSGVSGLVWERPDVNGSEPHWRLSIRLATEGDDMEADIEVQGLEAGPDELRAKPPDIVSIFFTGLHCALDDKRLSTTATKITMEQASSFRDELLNPRRTAPLLVVSEETMDADYLQRQLLGLVTVISYDRDTAWEISKNMPRPIRCYDGAIRLYSPNCSENDVSQQHPYWLPGDVDKLGRERMYCILRDECVNRLPRHGRRRLFSRVRDEIRREEINDLRSQVLNDDELLSLLMDDLIVDDVDSVSIAKHEAALKVARSFKNKVDALSLEIEQLANNGKLSDPEPVPDEPVSPEPLGTTHNEVKPEFANILEVIEWAHNELKGLHFLQEAFKSAEPVAKSGQFKRTEKLSHLFEVMNECASQRQGGSIGRLTRWFDDRQVTYARRESKSTNEQLPQTRIYDGIRMEEHFKLRDDRGGRFELRIHVFWDEQEYQWLIGHVGEHEPTSSDPH